MRTKVTDQGVVIPKDWFEGVSEVEVRRENGSIVIVPVQKQDPILQLGLHPVVTDVEDASTNHDKYIYGS